MNSQVQGASERERGRQQVRTKSKEDMREALKLSPEITATLTSRLAPVGKVKSATSTGEGANGSVSVGAPSASGADGQNMSAR